MIIVLPPCHGVYNLYSHTVFDDITKQPLIDHKKYDGSNHKSV